MSAALFEGAGTISVTSRDLPAPAPGEVRVNVLACALCGSDLRLFREGAAVTPGHEILGGVAAPGHPLDGRRVLVYIPVFCGGCARCRAGDTHLCETDPDLIGWNRSGGYADALNVPERCLLPVPDDIPDTLAPLLLDVIGTTAHAVRLAGKLLPPQCGALVLGAGPIGLGSILLAHTLGFSSVSVSEPHAYRRDLALSLGASPWNGKGGKFDLVLESSGRAEARQAAIESVAPHGVVALLGESGTPWPFTENRAIRRKDFWMLRSFYFPIGDFSANLALLRANLPAYRHLVDRTCTFENLSACFADFAAGRLAKPIFLPSAPGS
ncbi:MAG: alcohol dehydrogenase catalytic domain-containing protein [Rhodospirillales bacterium]|nr:alcohol dehydrogenase catalytic domain-containing protein [Rhodospirillales bacterium]